MLSFKRVVDVVELAALGCAAVAIGFLLFYKPAGPGTYQPASAGGANANDASAAAGGANAAAGGGNAAAGATIFVARCSGCHGSKGEGGIGPKLGGGAV